MTCNCMNPNCPCKDDTKDNLEVALLWVLYLSVCFFLGFIVGAILIALT